MESDSDQLASALGLRLHSDGLLLTKSVMRVDSKKGVHLMDARPNLKFVQIT
jgi:hypothetical protein